MLSLMLERNAPMGSGQFSTRYGPFSTQAAARIQLRDLIFVSTYSTGSYLTTGVESRSSVAFAPTIPVRNEALRARRRIERLRTRLVSRPS
jgi:hypothetical protein